MVNQQDIYIDPEVAYLAGLIQARGEFLEEGSAWKFIIRFPKPNLGDNETAIRLGMDSVRERIYDLTGFDVKTTDEAGFWVLVASSHRRTVAWRNLVNIFENKVHYRYFQVPAIILEPRTREDVKIEFLRGFADVNGNIRPANRDQTGLHRVRLDNMNNRTSWKVLADLCKLLQQHLNIPIAQPGGINWGHPNLNRKWKEHQLNVHAHQFTKIGFGFDFKQRILEDLAQLSMSMIDERNIKMPLGCPGPFYTNTGKNRNPRKVKPFSEHENDDRHLPSELVGSHYDSYYQICRDLGCQFVPPNVNT